MKNVLVTMIVVEMLVSREIVGPRASSKDVEMAGANGFCRLVEECREDGLLQLETLPFVLISRWRTSLCCCD